MELFTKHIETQTLILFLESNLQAKNISVQRFEGVYTMDWIIFSYDNQELRLIHHTNSRRFSFAGSLISVGLNVGVSDITPHIPLLEKIIDAFLQKFGGLGLLGDEVVESKDNDEELEDAKFLLARLNTVGANLSKVNEFLESELNKAASSKKGH
jgi:hypothetical protein